MLSKNTTDRVERIKLLHIINGDIFKAKQSHSINRLQQANVTELTETLLNMSILEMTDQHSHLDTLANKIID